MNPKKSMIKLKKGLNRIVAHPWTPYIVGGIVIIYLLVPFYWTLVQSFKPYQEVVRWPPTLYPHNFTLHVFHDVILRSPFPTYIMNSLIYSLATTAFVVVVGSLTAFGLSKFPFRGSDKLTAAFFLTRVIPPVSLLLPFFITYTTVGLNDTRLGVILFNIYLCYPLSVWLLKSFFDQFPDELIDSARVDGLSRLGVLRRIVMPVAAPGIAAVAAISFMWSWSAFMGPYLFTNSPSIEPITVGIYYWVGDQAIYWNSLSAAGLLAALPGAIFFLIAQRKIVSGLTAGALKGTT